jgi:hypothetical protein
MPIAGQPVQQSKLASGSVSAPGAGATIATITAANFPAGFYQVTAQVWYGAAAGGENDMALQQGGVTQYTFQIDAAAASNNPVTLDCVIKSSGGADLTIVAVAGGAGNYKASLVATKIRGL